MNSGVSASSTADLGLEFRGAAARNNIERLQELYSFKPGLLNSTGAKTGYSAMHQAASRGNIQAVQWLLEKNADYLLEANDGCTAIDLALRNQHFNIFAILYNHVHKFSQLPIDYSIRTTHYATKPLLLSCTDSETAISQLNATPGFLFSHYQAVCTSGLHATVLPSAVENHDISFKFDDIRYSIPAVDREHPNFIQMVNQHIAHRIAEMAERYQGGIIVLLNNDLAPVLSELRTLFPSVEGLFEQFRLPDTTDVLSEQLESLTLDEPSLQVTVDQLRQQARENALSPFQWENIPLFKEKLYAVLDEQDLSLDSNVERSKRRIEEILNFRVGDSSLPSPSSSSITSIEDLAEAHRRLSGLMDYKTDKLLQNTNFDVIRKVTREFFAVLEGSHTEAELKTAREAIVKHYYPFCALAQKREVSHSFTQIAMLYLIVKRDLISECLRKGTTRAIYDELSDLRMAASNLAIKSKVMRSFDLFAQTMLFNLVQSIQAQIHYCDPRLPLLSEYDHYIKLKNRSSRTRRAPTNIELINVWEYPLLENEFKRLVQKAICIKDGLQPRTQFVYYSMSHHAQLIDIDWDKQGQCFKIIFLEPSQVISMSFIAKMFCEELKDRRFSAQYLMCDAGLQKDAESCVLFCVMMASTLSYLSFDELNKHPGITREISDKPGGNIIDIPHTKWLPVTAFGEKLILMGQSSTDMRRNLMELYSGNIKKVNDTMHNWKRWYTFPGAQIKSKVDYVEYRRQSLYHKAMGTRPPYTLRQILETTQTDDLGPALRKLAVGVGPGQMLNQLLTQVSPLVINEAGRESKRTALHFAYQFNRLGRALRLEAQGANPELEDRQGLKPRECKR